MARTRSLSSIETEISKVTAELQKAQEKVDELTQRLLELQVQFAPHGGHWCVCQRPPGGAQRPPSLRYFDRLNNNNVMLRCPLHNSVG